MRHSLTLRAVAFLVLFLGTCVQLQAQTTKPVAPPAEKRVIRVALYEDEGSKGSAAKVEKCLAADPGRFSYKRVTAEDIRNGVLRDFDVVVQGGGSGSGQAKALQEKGCENIRQFVKDGGGYIGICAGAYLASSHYTWSLNILNAKVVDTKHWARGNGQVKLKLTAAGQEALAIKEQVVDCRYAQGPLLAPGDQPTVEPYKLLATYDSEIAEKGAPKGVMIGTTALATGNFGKGRVFVSSPHPEQTPGLEKIIRTAAEWAGAREGSSSNDKDR
jgi:glutamine amidotransferase-like uncharacterized protein